MVHGSGGFSGGGHHGGGFSGGGGFHHHHHYHHNHHGRHGESVDCSWVCVILCCRNQSWRLKIVALWFWITAIFLSASLSVLLAKYKAENMEATVKDMRKTDRTFSGSFCTGVTVSSSGSKFTAFLFQTPPIIDTVSRRTDIFQKHTEIDSHKYEYWGYYLLAGSKITISSCPDSSLKLYIIKGTDDFNKYIKEECFSACFVLNTDTYCYPGKPRVVTYDVINSDEYYIVFFNQYVTFYPTSLDVNFTLDRALYDTSYSARQCSNYNSDSCSLPYLSMSAYNAVVINVTSGMNDEGDAEIQISCNARSWVYILIFLVLPLVIGGLLSILIIKRYRKRSPEGNTSVLSSLDASSQPSVPYSAFQNEADIPPSYEDATKKTVN